jgi:pilus assembly protein CpaB
VSGADQRAEDKAKLVEAYVAKQDIAKGTSGDQVIGSDLLEKRAVPREAVPSAAVRNSATLKGKVAAAAISSGQFIVADQFVAPGQGGGVGGTLAAGKEAITISVDQAHGVAGFINPGDHVNVISLAKIRKDPQAPFSPGQPDNVAHFVVQNVEVLAVGQGTDAPAASDSKTTSTTQANNDANRGLVTVAVDAVDAERIAFVAQNYQIYLTLVPPGYTPQNVPAVGDVAVIPPIADLLRKY